MINNKTNNDYVVSEKEEQITIRPKINGGA